MIITKEEEKEKKIGRPKGAFNLKNESKFRDWFKHQRKKTLPSISKINIELGFSTASIGNYFEQLEKEGKIKIYIENGKLKKIVKL